MTPESVRHSPSDRGAILVGISAIVLASFVFGRQLPIEFRWLNIGATGASLLALSGILSIVSGTLRRRVLRLIAGALLVVGAVAQLVGLAASVRPLGGDASTMAVVGGLGIALLILSQRQPVATLPNDPMKGTP